MVLVLILARLLIKMTYFKQTKLQSDKSCCTLLLMYLLMFFSGHKEPTKTIGGLKHYYSATGPQMGKIKTARNNTTIKHFVP